MKDTAGQTIPRPAADQPLSPTVRALGVVSLFADISSEMVYPLNPIFVTQILGAPAWALGVIEGIAESTASLLKIASGWMSDRFGSRKPFAVAGYALGALGKPIIAVSGAWWQVLAGRFVDRFGKGLRTAPRDALIAENCLPEQRGRAFGFHRSLDTVGAVLGPLLGFLFLQRFAAANSAHAFRSLYALAFVPGLIGVLILALFVREKRKSPLPPGPSEGAASSAPTNGGRSKRRPYFAPALTARTRSSLGRGNPTDGLDLKRTRPSPVSLSMGSFSPAYRRYLLIVGLFSLGNSSDTFLLLRARDMGVAADRMLLLYALFNVVEACLGYGAGTLSDRVPRRWLIAAGYGVFALVYLGFAILSGPAAVWMLFPVYGLYYTLTQGVQRALAADLAPPDRPATEIGAFHTVVGLAALPASVAAGWLYGLAHSAPFFLGAATAALAAVLLLVARLT